MSATPLTAVIWDFDGTLIDTRRRNYSVVCRLMTDVTGMPADEIPALESIEHYDRIARRYVNWRELYRREFGFSEEDTDRVGRLWSEYQLSDDTAALPFDGIDQVLERLGSVPHGVVSQNARDQIERALRQFGMHEHFGFVAGYDSVPLGRQKPAPDGLMACIDALTEGAAGRVLYIGDHETDVRCAQNAQTVLAERGLPVRVQSVAAAFLDNDDPRRWTARPDFIAHAPRDIIAVALSAGAQDAAS